MTYQEALDYIGSVSWQGSRPGLERIAAIMEQLGNVQDTLKYIHIAGTNGKGSVSAMLSSVLTAAGYRTGLFISPFIKQFNERMQVDGVPISNEELAQAVEAVRPAADALPDGATEFELITAAAFVWFARKQCDLVVLETGMGGRLDATNLIRADECAIITNLGMDHMEYLGDTLEKIAYEKACIIKPGAPVVAYPNAPAVLDVIQQKTTEQGGTLRVPALEEVASVSDSLDGQTFRYRNGPDLHIHLLGSHQLKNAAVVLEAVEILRQRGWRISDEALAGGLKATRWPARFDVVCRAPVTVVDGAHNPQGMDSLCQAIRAYLPDRRIVCLVGVMADKDWYTMMDQLKQVATVFVCVRPDSPRALDPQILADYLADGDHWATTAESVTRGMDLAQDRARQQDGAVVACGSLYMAGDVLRYFEGNTCG